MTHHQLAAMTDEERDLRAHQRAKHGDPYMPLSMAKKMQRVERKWSHLRRTQLSAPEPCRYGDGTCLTHSGGRRHHERDPSSSVGRE